MEPITRTRYTNPIENLRSYIMERGGLMKNERIADLEWVEDKIKAGDRLASAYASSDPAAIMEAIKAWKEL